MTQGPRLAVLEGLGNIQPESLTSMQVPEITELDRDQWTGIAITGAVSLVAGAVTAWAVGGRPLAGALIGLGGSAVAFSVFPPIWLRVERARCAVAAQQDPAVPASAPVAPGVVDLAAERERRLREAVIASPRHLGAADDGTISSGAEVPVVRAFTRPSSGMRTMGGIAGAALVGLGLLVRGA